MIRILHTNDFHGTLDDARQARLAALREEVDLYFDCGDCIKAGNLAVPLKPEAVWPRLAALGCSASVIGNRESHPLEGPFRAKIAGASHPLLCGNLTRRSDGELVLPASMVFEVSGLRVGVFAVMVAMVTERMLTRVASQFLWSQPLATAERLARELRPQVDCLIALTHIGFMKDLELAQRCPEIDFILGGHSHTLIDGPRVISPVDRPDLRTSICQTGSHGRFAGRYDWTPEQGMARFKMEPLTR